MPTNDEIIRSRKSGGGLAPMCEGCIFRQRKNTGRCFDTLKLMAAAMLEAAALESRALREGMDDGNHNINAVDN